MLETPRRHVLALSLLWLSGGAQAADLPSLVRESKPSVVLVGTHALTDSPRFTFRGTGFVAGDGLTIVTNAHDVAMRFLQAVDASCVLINASTRFNDGGELGLGAELGISTTKLHAYGPMGLQELCTRKFVVLGHGEVR